MPRDDVTPETIAVLEPLLAKALNGPWCAWPTVDGGQPPHCECLIDELLKLGDFNAAAEARQPRVLHRVGEA